MLLVFIKVISHISSLLIVCLIHFTFTKRNQHLLMYEKVTMARTVLNLGTKLKIFKLGNEQSVSVIEWNNIYICKHNCS